ncbi:sigma 54-interacting transcriptional regulator [Hyphomonas sp.]|uniref:sigma-54-dependent transcriptional regulator n=1 Tax=Hyphomonas sp. TaxID=87 RepID=UPI0025BF250F|nr:sigma 54-interacting transcriptional regulator [Hyphomonas sp.]
MGKKILVVDDVPVSAQMEPYLAPFGFEIEQVTKTEGAERKVEEFDPDLILLDLHFDDDEVGARRTTGGAFHTVLRQRFPHIPVLIFSTRPANNEIPAETFELRPLAIVSKPDLESENWAPEFARRLDRAIAEFGRKADDYTHQLGFPVGQTEAMLEFARRLSLAAPSHKSILLRGETGTGKEIAARAIHRASGRSGEFVVARIAALPKDLMLASLFGHPAGAMRSVSVAGSGLLNTARNGTLFIDEVGDLTIEAQAALIACLDQQTEQDSSNQGAKPSDARIVSGTQHDLNEQFATGGFRRDLKDRLAEFELSLPPLRHRLQDIPALFSQIVEEFNSSAPMPVSPQLRPETLAKLSAHDWPGNIREFRNVLTSALMWTQNEILMPEDIDFEVIPYPKPVSNNAIDERNEPQTTIELEARLVVDGLFAKLDSMEQGPERYEFYKDLPKYMLRPVNEKIFSVLRERLGNVRLQQIELGQYLFGDRNTAQTWDRVRGYVSQNKAWPLNR